MSEPKKLSICGDDGIDLDSSSQRGAMLHGREDKAEAVILMQAVCESSTDHQVCTSLQWTRGEVPARHMRARWQP